MRTSWLAGDPPEPPTETIPFVSATPDRQRDAEGASRVVGDPRPRAADRWGLRAGGHRPNVDLRRYERRQLRPWPVLDGWHDAHGCARDPQRHRHLPCGGRTPTGHGAARPAYVSGRDPAYDRADPVRPGGCHARPGPAAPEPRADPVRRRRASH